MSSCRLQRLLRAIYSLSLCFLHSILFCYTKTVPFVNDFPIDTMKTLQLVLDYRVATASASLFIHFIHR